MSFLAGFWLAGALWAMFSVWLGAIQHPDLASRADPASLLLGVVFWPLTVYRMAKYVRDLNDPP